MYTVCILVFFLLAVTKSIFGNTDSKVPQSCPYKCDLLQEITLLRQMVNHESILRMGLETQMQEMRKLINDGLTEVRQDVKNINSSMESSSISHESQIKDEISKGKNRSTEGCSEVTGKLENLERSVQDTDTSLRRTNSIINDGLTEVRRDVQQINSSVEQSSISHKDELSKVTEKLENLEKSVRNTDTKLGHVNTSLQRTDNTITVIQNRNRDMGQVMTSMQRDIQALNQTTLQMKGKYFERNMYANLNLIFKIVVCKKLNILMSSVTFIALYRLCIHNKYYII